MNLSIGNRLTSNIRRCALATASLAVIAAWGQSAVAQEAGAAEIEEILVTGSRIARDGYAAPTPVNVLGTEEISAAAPANIADFVNTLPSVAGSSTAANSSGSLSNGAAGISALNLRALGTGRTLVLFDGQRSVVSAATGQVDTNTFPQSLISRVEVVTGGASSAYGSDAIGGVVNFILDKEYTGLKSSLEYGETTYGDGENWKFNVTAGGGFAGGKGHFLASAEWVGQDGVHTLDRDWNRSGYFAIRNTDLSAGAPYYIVSDKVGISTYTPGGLITAGPLRGTYFGVNGAVNQLAYGAVSGQWMVGGDWDYSSSGIVGTNTLIPDEDRESYFGRASYEITPNIELFIQGSYAKYEGLSYYISPTQTGITIRSDNAFLPASVRTQMTSLGLTSFTMGTSNIDMPASGSAISRETERYVVGGKGDFSALGLDFAWDAYYQHGETKTHEQLTPTWNTARLTLATDAVLSNGQIVCRSTITNPTNGCVPLNRFGVGVASQAALNYVLGTPLRDQVFKQDVAAFNVTTSSIQGWAGPISFATGAEYRKEKMSGSVDPQYESGWKYGNFRVTRGEYDVVEAYAEAVVPLLTGLDFNGAFRVTDYSTSGTVKTWKAGLTYQPIPDIKFRASASRDIRAANMSELYDAGTARSNSVNINGVSVAFVQNLQGNPQAKPEVADGYGVGVVVSPRFLPGVQASIDYYDIKVDGVISFVTAQQVADYCYIQNVSSYCSNLKFTNGVLSTIDLYYDNLNQMTAKGLDIEASYRTDLEDVASWAKGALTLRAMFTHYIENVTDDGVTAIDLAGANTTSTPDWVYRLTATYGLDPWTFNVTARGVSDGVVSNAYTECQSACPASVAPYYTINDNSIKGALYFDVQAAYDFEVSGVGGEAFFSVKNLFNSEPVLLGNPNNLGAENTVGYPQTNRNLYDTMGRTFRMGLRLEF
ncbi:TonB-dependent receptor plug domain-containing protein [Caulobacter sp. NIBR2454]|uniref:TonB-dependent receptor plug domain-containing protein n=1 Tax=Caulobacter sp. NIBR2454 TaxID=3015996 RepID=UPI0022B60818|nr:TonB-dependent receptor [Caulobacter sp. NIBR2454]